MKPAQDVARWQEPDGRGRANQVDVVTDRSRSAPSECREEAKSLANVRADHTEQSERTDRLKSRSGRRLLARATRAPDGERYDDADSE
jgi:hypothetical protein